MSEFIYFGTNCFNKENIHHILCDEKKCIIYFNDIEKKMIPGESSKWEGIKWNHMELEPINFINFLNVMT